jgi:shikimate kinase
MARLFSYLTEGINDVGILHAIFMAGNPGSGKSYVISKIRSGSIEAKVVNTDKFFEFLGNQDIPRSKLLTSNQLELYVDSMLPLCVDGTSTNTSNTLKRKAILETLGYKTGMLFVNCDIETSIKRARARQRKVPEDIIVQSYEAMQKVKPVYNSAFDFFIETDNDNGDLNDSVILSGFRKTVGFFKSPLSPKGQEIIDRMKAEGMKYLTDGIYDKPFISQVVSNWYENKQYHSI